MLVSQRPRTSNEDDFINTASASKDTWQHTTPAMMIIDVNVEIIVACYDCRPIKFRLITDFDYF